MFLFFKGIPSISTKELADKLSTSPIILDVRTSQEFRSGHIGKSKNVPLQKIPMYQGKEKEVYVICQSGMRSKKAAKILRKKGYDVVNIRGGMNTWSGPTRGGK